MINNVLLVRSFDLSSEKYRGAASACVVSACSSLEDP